MFDWIDIRPLRCSSNKPRRTWLSLYPVCSAMLAREYQDAPVFELLTSTRNIKTDLAQRDRPSPAPNHQLVLSLMLYFSIPMSEYNVFNTSLQEHQIRTNKSYHKCAWSRKSAVGLAAFVQTETPVDLHGFPDA